MGRFATAGIALLFLIFLSSATSAGQAARASSDRKQILEVERKFTDTVVSNDVRELEDILAEDYLGTETDGKLVTKADSVAEAKSGSSEYASCRLNENEVKVRFYGDVAVVNGTENWTRKDGKSGRFIWTDIMVKRQGKWKVVASQDLAVLLGK
jgi:hypothetical protein